MIQFEDATRWLQSCGASGRVLSFSIAVARSAVAVERILILVVLIRRTYLSFAIFEMDFSTTRETRFRDVTFARTSLLSNSTLKAYERS